MTRPRRALGPQLPGRLAATRLRVLAAEMSDAGRLSRGKAYWAEGAVTDIDVARGRVTGTVQGSRRTPYEVTLDANIGRGMPVRREVFVSCSCPDDEGTGQHACKHVVAVLFQFSEEVSIDPELIDLWRCADQVTDRSASTSADDLDDDLDEDPDDDLDEDLDGRWATVVPIRPGVATRQRPSAATPPAPSEPERLPHMVLLDRLLLPPAGAALPALPVLGHVVHPGTGNPYVDDMISDALSCCQIWWR